MFTRLRLMVCYFFSSGKHVVYACRFKIPKPTVYTCRPHPGTERGLGLTVEPTCEDVIGNRRVLGQVGVILAGSAAGHQAETARGGRVQRVEVAHHRSETSVTRP